MKAILFGATLILVLTGHPIARTFTAAPLVTLGTYSYGLYVLAAMLQPHLERWLSTNAMLKIVPSPPIAGLAHFAGHVVVDLALAVLVYRWYEAPFLRLKERFR